jgi:hypothetical protein
VGYFTAPYDDEPRAFAAEGFPTIVGELAGAQTFGNPASVSAVDDARAYLVSRFGCDPTRFLLAGASAGTLTALSWLLANPSGGCLAVAVTVPALDLQDLHDNRGYGAQIETAYGGLAAYQAALPTHSPVVFASSLPAGIPIRLWTSSNDPVVIPASADSFVANAPNVSRVDLGPVGHDVAAVSGADMAAWLKTQV